MIAEYIIEGEDYPDEALEFKTSWDPAEYPSYVAEDAAENYHDYLNGDEVIWPIRIVIYVNQEEIGTFEVDKEYNPSFSATKV